MPQPIQPTRRDLLAATPAALLGLGLVGSLNTAALAQQAEGPLNLFRQSHDGTAYTLPKLPYAYDALEPHIDAQTMELHHSKHHQSYVDGLNKTLAALAEMRAGEFDDPRLYGLQRNLSFNGSGHVLHTLFWATMAPDAGGEPQGSISEAINQSFGSFDAFKTYFSKAAGGVKGSGWAILAYEPVGGNLVVFSVNEHDQKMIGGAIPLLPLDVWEHAYYLKYQNKRADYIAAWFNVINWNAVDAIYAMHHRAHHAGA